MLARLLRQEENDSQQTAFHFFLIFKTGGEGVGVRIHFGLSKDIQKKQKFLVKTFRKRGKSEWNQKVIE